MRWTSIVMIYLLFWALSFFFVLPFRLQSCPGEEPVVPGQFAGAPSHFSFARTSKWTTLVAAVLFGLYYANYVEQWVPVDALNFVPDSLMEGR